ncbi:MAG: oxidoreductase [Candidatus Rokuibacteriota bacterium]|nr:MAG: oxidoreductase [Candidatus Rokubacteria bacterium]
MGRRHADNLARSPSVDLVRVVDADEGAARTTGAELGVEWSTSFDDLLRDPRIEGVVLATPTALHAAMVEQAAAAGKHVFCEKPIAIELAPTLHAVEAAAAARVKLQVGFHRRFDPDWAAARERIARGELGDVYLFRSSLRDPRPPAMDYVSGAGGLFVDVTIHDLDTARWMVGEIEEVTAVGAALSDPAFETMGEVDHGIVMLRFASGALGVIDNSRASGYGYECSAEVMGSQATVRIDRHRRVYNEWLTAGTASVERVMTFTELFQDAYRTELESFAAAIREDRPPAVTGGDALAAFMLACACERSLHEGRTIRLEREEGPGGAAYQLQAIEAKGGSR